LGKIIGGGLPIGAYGGPADIMDLVAPLGPVYQAGTLSGHSLAMAAGIATLDQLTDERYGRLSKLVDRLERGLVEAARASRRPVSVGRFGPLITLFFTPNPPRNGDDALTADRSAYARFFRHMLESGALLPPSQFEAWFPGFAHGEAEIEIIVDAASRWLSEDAAR
jgi:glutamate-1-semialdehyde 2,1-aminomutase